MYNPRSKKRVRQLEEAVEIFRAARSGQTPVGIVTAAGQDDQSLVVTDLDHLLEQEVDMRTVVIIGNSSTRRIDHWMVTARGYFDRVARMTSMILLLGGTSDTRPIAMRLAEAGYRVLVSQATDVPLDAPRARATSRAARGPLDEHGLAELVDRRGIRAIVDATHPYAVAIHAAASRVADDRRHPLLAFRSPGGRRGGRSRRGVCRRPRGGRSGRISSRPARAAHHRNAESCCLTSSSRVAPACG